MFKEEFDLKAKRVSDSVEELKKDFVQLITNKEISLNERWEIFLHALIYVKDTYSFNEYFPDELTHCFGFDILDELSETYGVISITRLFELSENPIDVDKTKEVILKYNIGAFHA